jgi:hypothetical protein
MMPFPLAKPDILKLNVFKDTLTRLPYVIGEHATTEGKGKMIRFIGLSQKHSECFTLQLPNFPKK